MIEQFIHEGIIECSDIKSLQTLAQQSERRIVFLDSTFVLPNSDEDIVKNFASCHIPNALFFDIKAVADPQSDLPHMIPEKHIFENALSELGIHNSDIVITYGQHGMIMGPARVWWMFRGFGHNDVLVLNGGLPSWKEEGFETQSGESFAIKKTNYQAKTFNQDICTDMQCVINISEQRHCPIIDARPAERFDGSSPEPREGMRSGSIPNSVNLPCSQLVNADGKFKTKDELKALFKNIGIDAEKQQQLVTTCGSGITACALSLALFHIGIFEVAVYDGSWSEWGLESSPTKIAS